MAKKKFKAESKRLLDLMINSIYTNREIFLREIISNASDAEDKLHYISLTDENARRQTGELSIRLSFDKDARTVTVEDFGIGMTKEELEENLGTICKSGSLNFKEEMTEAEEKEAVNIIGQFGVGFYSAFMVSDRLTVITRSYKSETAYIWESDGADGYTIEETEREKVGTAVIMHLKEDTENENYSEYLSEYRLKNLVRTYSDYIRYPIIMTVEKTREEGEGEDKKTVNYFEDETVNSMVPVWKKAKKDTKKEETDEFYKTAFFDRENPLFTVHMSAEGDVCFKALLFIPSVLPYDYFTKEYKTGLKLYSSGVLITDSCPDLLSEHFRFVKGVVETDDLSLNISRETLQKDASLKKIAKNIDKKIKNELEKALKNEREKYEKFWSVFGIQLKYGTVSSFGMNKDELKDLLLFRSLNENKFVTVKEYTEKMPEDQKHIYYACGTSLSGIGSLPQAEAVRDKGYDILCLTDEVDEFVMQVLHEEDGKDFLSIDSDMGDLISEEEKQNAEKTADENKELLEFVKAELGISDAVISKKLKTHAVCLSAKGGVTLEMEKYFASLPGDDKEKVKAERVLELNPAHPVFTVLADAFKNDKEKAGKIAKVLYTQSLLIAGLPVENPTEYSENVCELIK